MSGTPTSDKKRVSFKLDFPGNANVREALREKIQAVKSVSPIRMTNTDVVMTALDFWITSNTMNSNVPPEHTDTLAPCGNVTLGAENDENLFLSSVTATENLIQISEYHGRRCRGSLAVDSNIMCGPVGVMKLKCQFGHFFTWNTSPSLPDGTHFATAKFIHGYLSCALLPNQVERISQVLGFSKISVETATNCEEKYQDIVHKEKEYSCEDALMSEIGSSFDDDGEIGIMTDARHGWRRNAKDTNVICIGQKTHKVIKDIYVTKSDDPVTQRHEMLGTKKLYEYFDSNIESIGGPVLIKSHAHDRNLSVNSFVKKERNGTCNQNDTWHAAKSVEKEISAVSKGPKSKHGITWHEELSDKVQSVRTHVQYSIRNCDNDSTMLISKLDNIVLHYKNQHDKCSPESRCKTDGNYEPSKRIVASPVAEKLLAEAIRRTVVYRSPSDFIYALDTYYVEGFNNVLNVFQDKRINFSDTVYRLRTDLAICHWNENVDRPFTSVWTAPDEKKTRKNYKPRTYVYRDNIWKKFKLTFH